MGQGGLEDRGRKGNDGSRVNTSSSGRWDTTLPKSSQTTGGMISSTRLRPAW